MERGESLSDALVREIREETGIMAAAERLVVVHSNLTSVRGNPAKVVLGFRCRAVAGEPVTSAESLAVEWVPRESVLTRIRHRAIRVRAEALLADAPGVIYSAYVAEPFAILETLAL